MFTRLSVSLIFFSSLLISCYAAERPESDPFFIAWEAEKKAANVKAEQLIRDGREIESSNQPDEVRYKGALQSYFKAAKDSYGQTKGDAQYHMGRLYYHLAGLGDRVKATRLPALYESASGAGDCDKLHGPSRYGAEEYLFAAMSNGNKEALPFLQKIEAERGLGKIPGKQFIPIGVNRPFAEFKGDTIIGCCGWTVKGHDKLHPKEKYFCVDVVTSLEPDLVANLHDPLILNYIPPSSVQTFVLECVPGNTLCALSIHQNIYRMLKPGGVYAFNLGGTERHEDYEIKNILAHLGFKNIEERRGEIPEYLFKGFGSLILARK